MNTRVKFELTPKEFEILKKALYNYRGRLIHLKNNGFSLNEVEQGHQEMRILENMMKEFNGED